jgi:hypothetical protein
MAREDEASGVTKKVEDVLGNSSNSKEVLASAAVSAVGALAAAKRPDLVRKLAGATEEKGENEAEQMGEKAVEGAKKGRCCGVRTAQGTFRRRCNVARAQPQRPGRSRG